MSENPKIQKLKSSKKINYRRASKNKTHLQKIKNIDETDSSEEESKQNKKIEIIEFSDNLLEIKKGKYYYLLDRYKYDINTIMMLLDLTKINKLHDFYKNYPDGIEKINFVQKMKKEIAYNLNDPMDGTNLVYGLYKFFSEIDFNGDGHMQWEEFTQFIIDTVEGDSEAKVEEKEDDNIKKIFNEKKMFKYKRYYLNHRTRDNMIHKREVISAIFLPRADLILINEYGTKVINIYNPKTGKNIKNYDLETFINPKNYLSLAGDKYKKKSEINFMKKRKNHTKNTIYSVLSMTVYQSLVAMCLSDKRIIFLNFASDDRIEFIHEMYLPVLEKRIWYLKEHNIWVCSGIKLDNFPYYTLNELDIEFECHNQKYDCLFNNDHPYRNHYCHTNPHKGEIMDCLEIIRPMMVITACMDGKIRLFNISNKESIKIWNYHSLGVRSLDYNPLIEGIGYILSVGFEYYINLYCADLSIDEAYKGKLEGHYSPVISCKFIAHSYMAVSVDEEANVRIWDTRAKLCLQLISPPKKKCKVNNLLGLFKYNKFLIYGNKIFYYDAKYKEEEIVETNQVKDDNYPIKIEYNYYYQQFFVATFKDIRVYSKDGEIYKIYKKLNTNEHFDNSDVKIKNFIFENNYRKFYVGFSNGAIMQFNAGNGSLVKPINENEIEKDGIQIYEYSHSKDISSLFFYKNENDDNNLFLLSSSFDSLINVYNEQNPEETEQLRTLRGGHTIDGKNYEILCMDFSMVLNLFATGGSDGLVVIWDFEMSKIEDVLLIDLSFKISVTFLKFLDPYSILSVSYSDGTLYFWGVKQHEKEGECLFRTRNYEKIMGRIDVCNIKYMNLFSGNIPDMKYDVPLKKYFDENSPFMNYNIKNLDKKINGNSIKDNSFDINSSEKENHSENDDENIKLNENEKEKEINLDIVPDIYKNEIIDKELDRDLYEEKENIEKNKQEYNIIKPQYYLFLGDEHGNLKILDLMGYIKKNNLEPSSQTVIKSTFNLYKKDDINVTAILKHNLSTRKEKIFPQFTNIYYKVLIRELKAHYDEITCITIIQEPLTFTTCSKDEYVKIFNFKCECIGVINALPKMSKFPNSEVKWNFKINEKKILEKEILEVMNIFEKVGLEPIKIGSYLDLKLNQIRYEEKNKKNLENKKKEENVKKKRFKPLVKEEIRERPKSGISSSGYISYEGYYVQNYQKNIEDLFNKGYPNYGMNEITNQLIGTMVETEKNKKLKEIEEKEKKMKEEEKMRERNKLLYKSFNTIGFSPKNKKTPIHKSNTSIDLKKFFNNVKMSTFSPQNNNEDLKATYSPKDKNLVLSTNTNSNNNILTFSNYTNENNVINSFRQIESSFLNEKSSSNNNIVNLNTNFFPRRTSILSNKNSSFASIPEYSEISKVSQKSNQKEIFKRRIEFKKIPKKIISSQKANNYQLKNNSFLKLRNIKKINPNFRDELFTSRLYRRNLSNNKLDENDISKNNIYDKNKTLLKLKNTKLPFLYDKIIFKKGETEKLLNYQFYSSSYRSCCDTKKTDGINNIPLKTNYKNNWNFVKRFVEQKYKEDKNHNIVLLKIAKIKNEKINNREEKNNNDDNNLITNITNYKTSIPSELQNFHSDTENIS